jgi:uncharacterized protein
MSENPAPLPPEDPASAAPPPLGGVPSREDRLWATFIHLSSIIGSSSWALGIPGGNLLLPLILWLVKRDGAPFVDDQGKEALNFQITMTIAGIGLLFIVCVGWALLPALGVFSLVASIVAAIKANEGLAYRYPLTLRLVK